MSVPIPVPYPLWSELTGALAPAQVVSFGPINVANMQSVVGNVRSDVVGVLTVAQERTPGGGGLLFVVTQDLTQPAFQFPFIIAVIAPYVTFTWTNGAGAAVFMEAAVKAVPF